MCTSLYQIIVQLLESQYIWCLQLYILGYTFVRGTSVFTQYFTIYTYKGTVPILFEYLQHSCMGLIVCSRYSNWLQAGWSGDRIPVGGENFHTCPDWPWGPPSLLYNGYWVFPGGKERLGHDADPSPLLVPW
jgi:hypothetical protein